MRSDYKEAKKLAEEAVAEAKRNNISPYLPVLDSNEEINNSLKIVKLGLMELPVDRIIGNKEQSRNNAFANNFMPLLEESSEFAIKWWKLFDSFLEEGIRNAIIVYEYMNDYYVQEGNKRVSVSKYGGMEFILAEVRRIVHEKKDTKKYKAYAEYMDFYEVTKNPYIVLKDVGSYQRIAGLMGETLDRKWEENNCADMKAAFFKFCSHCRSTLKITDVRDLSEAFLMYISIFPIKTILCDEEDQIIKNIRTASAELIAGSGLNDTFYFDSVPEAAEQKGLIAKLFSGTRKYTAVSPLKVGFIYDAEIDESRWIDSHEAGRLLVDEMTGDNVVTEAYICEKNNVRDAVEKAVSDGCGVIFTVSPSMLGDAVKAAVKHPNVKILNCSFGKNAASVRCYYGKMYEASFLMGILAADRLLTEYGGGNVQRKIGYLARTIDHTSVRVLNAFAVGVSMIDPECRISLKCDNPNSPHRYRREWAKEGVQMFADFDCSSVADVSTRVGLFMIKDDKDVYLGKPFFNWGKYYVQMVQSVLSGIWEVSEKMKISASTNYWFQFIMF
ncbi:MAG: BMP family ABC transporter substrate-binding protein [Ruminococcus sp.]|uniref:BMP family ABC transporter substrate-binding protein n=1 Tax=Ruminococcus sp. TaxID=41978 RepID=UPI0025E038B9|nr:BMP family ABC transporter substrate-binding protein [Ruminococcus sp.]MCR5540964.1 BMP family ABC transporter substrate-binding protein [Ruminococcus sp.]